MCRLAAFPAGTPPEQAHEIIAHMVKGNDDGVGSAYVKDGEFILKKYPYSYQEAVTKKNDIFNHMPYNGWTIAHVRYGTHGGNTIANTHPIVRGDICAVHNGVFGASEIIRAAMDDSVKWAGETDSEVAIYMLNKLGRDKFHKVMPMGAGVYVYLNRDGKLDAVKCSGDLRFLKTDQGKYILSSEFEWKAKDFWVDQGCYGFNEDGTARDWTEKKKETVTYSSSEIWRGGRRVTSDESRCDSRCGNTQTHTSDTQTAIITIPSTVEKVPPSLWNWQTEQQILDYIRSMDS